MKTLKNRVIITFYSFGQIFLWIFSRILVKTVLKTKLDMRTLIEKSDRPTVFLSNHVALTDASLIVGLLSWREFRAVSPLMAMLAKWYYYSPMWPVVFLIGCFPARPLFMSRKKHAGTGGAVKHLNRGATVGLFPQGKREPNGRGKARYGVVKILQQVENPRVYICRIKETGKRQFSVVIDRNDTVANMTDPEKIMDTIFKLDK